MHQYFSLKVCVYYTFSRVHEMTGMMKPAILYEDVMIIVA